MRFFGRSLTGLVLLAVTLALLGFAAQLVAGAVRARLADDGPARPQAERIFATNVMTIQPGPVTPVLTAFGEVRSRTLVVLRAPRAGTVLWVAEGVQDGADVAAGQPLLRIDPAEAKAALALAEADMAQVRADLAEAEAAVSIARDDLTAAQAQADLRAQALTRQRDLAARGIGSAAAVETAALAASGADQAVLSRRQALASAEAAVAQARVARDRQAITVSEAARALTQTEVLAPFAGRLDGVAVTAGAMVATNEEFGRIIDPVSLEVAFRLSTAQFAQVLDASGAVLEAPVQIALSVPGAEVLAEGRLTRAGAAVGEGQSGRLVYAGFQSTGGFQPGDFVTLRIKEPPLAQAAVLPATAIGPAGTVLALGPEDRLEEVPVTVMRRQGDDAIISGTGLAGREVVTQRSPLLGAGIRIRPVRPGKAAAPDAATLLDLTEDRRAALIAFVEKSARMPAEAKAQVLDQLRAGPVPAEVVQRLEARMGG